MKLTTMIFLAACCSLYPATMINTNQVLTNYGFKDGSYDYTSSLISRIHPLQRIQVGKIEDSSLLDTPEEFLTATYFSPIKITNVSAKKKIASEMPHNKEGVLKLTAMWLRKGIEKKANIKAYTNAINLIKTKAKKKYSINVTNREIYAFYNNAIEKKIITTATKYFRKTAYASKSKVIATTKPLIAYYQNPTTANFDKIVRKYAALGYITSSNGWIANNASLSLAFKRTVDEMNGKLGTRMLQKDAKLTKGK